MGLEHELKDIIEDGVEDGVEKGIVKAVEKLINKGLITKVVQITINTTINALHQEICKIGGIGAITSIASNTLENAMVCAAQKTMEDIKKASTEGFLKQIQDILINLIKSKYGDIIEKKLEEEIMKIIDVAKLSLLIQKVVECETMEDFISNIKN